MPQATLIRRRDALATLSATLAAAATLPSAAWAQAPYPSKPIKMVVGYAPGGSVDTTARIVSDLLAAQLGGATVVVDNLAGAAGVLGAQRVVSSPPDGYTVMTGSMNELLTTVLVNPNQKYDPQKDLQIIGLVGMGPILLIASPKTGVKTLAEFVDLVKRNPGKFSYGTSGIGSALHFAGELLKKRAGLFMTHIPYRGTAPLTTDLVGSTIEFAMLSPSAAGPFLQNNRLVALGITSPKRFELMPHVPALAEHPLLKGYDLQGWYALAAPRGLPPELTQRLKTALQAGLKDPAIKKRLQDSGSVPATGHEDVARFMRDDAVKYAELVKFANMRE